MESHAHFAQDCQEDRPYAGGWQQTETVFTPQLARGLGDEPGLTGRHALAPHTLPVEEHPTNHVTLPCLATSDVPHCLASKFFEHRWLIPHVQEFAHRTSGGLR